MDTLRKSLDAFISVILPFESSVRCVTNATQISATYDGTEISFGINYSYSFRNLTFNPQFSERSAQLIMYPDDGAVITDETLVDLVRLHFEQGTLTTAD